HAIRRNEKATLKVRHAAGQTPCAGNELVQLAADCGGLRVVHPRRIDAEDQTALFCERAASAGEEIDPRVDGAKLTGEKRPARFECSAGFNSREEIGGGASYLRQRSVLRPRSSGHRRRTEVTVKGIGIADRERHDDANVLVGGTLDRENV